jgi:hypothetical protein
MKKLRDIIPLEELSKETLRSYIKKSTENFGMSNFRHGKLYGKELVTKKKSLVDREEGHKEALTQDKRRKGISRALNHLVKEDREEHMKKHGDKACAYAEKIKKCCEEFCKVAGKYDDYELKSLARELEDIYERLDNNVSSKKEMKKHQDAMKSSPTVYEEVEELDELSRKTLKNYRNNAEMDVFNMKASKPHGQRPKLGKRIDGIVKASARLAGVTPKQLYDVNKNPIYAKEDVEQIDELSKNTLMNYHGLAKARMRLSGPKDSNIRIKGKPLPRSMTADRSAGINLAAKKLGEKFKAEKAAKKEAQKIARRKTKPVNEGKFSELDIVRQEKEAKEKAKLRNQLKKKMGKRIVN